jgi:hypothetical protein
MLLRYAFALSIAGLLIGGGMLFVYLTMREVHGLIDQEERQLAETSDPAAGEVAEPSWGSELPEGLKLRLSIADTLVTFHLILIPVVIAGCLLFARSARKT